MSKELSKQLQDELGYFTDEHQLKALMHRAIKVEAVELLQGT